MTDLHSIGSLLKCRHCDNYHSGVCSRVKSIEYWADGSIKKVEYWLEVGVYKPVPTRSTLNGGVGPDWMIPPGE